MQLIMADGHSVLERLVMALGDLSSERPKRITARSESAASGHSPVIIITPLPGKESWGRVVENANHYEDQGFVVILVATSADLNRWVETLDDGSIGRDGLHLDKLPEKCICSKPQDTEDDWSC